MKIISITIVSLVFLVSCATVHDIIGPDGTAQKLVTCKAISNCYEDARLACQGNYKITNTSSNVRTDTQGDSYSTTELLVKCDKNPINKID